MPKLSFHPVVGLLLVVTLTSASIAAWNYHRMSVRVAQLEHSQRVFTSLSAEFIQRAEFDRALRQARIDTLQRLEELRHEDTPDGQWLRQSIPDGVRKAARPD